MMHQPAWKRLGLQLKASRENVKASNVKSATENHKKSAQQHGINSRKYPSEHTEIQQIKQRTSRVSKRSKDGTTEPKTNKRRRKLEADSDNSASNVPDPIPGKGNEEESASSERTIRSTETPGLVEYAERAANLDTPSLKRKKSVTFSSDTKEVDGFGTRVLYNGSSPKLFSAVQSTPVMDDNPRASLDSEEATSAVRPATVILNNGSDTNGDLHHEDASTAEEREANKKKRKAESRARAEPKEIPKYVQYLLQYHTARDRWKFSKSLQSDLLKNLFNVFRVPTDCNDAISAYLAGLQGQARERVRETAREIVLETRPFGTLQQEVGQARTDDVSHLDKLEEGLGATSNLILKLDSNETPDDHERFTALKKRKRAQEVLLALLKSDANVPPPKPQISLNLPPPGSNIMTATSSGQHIVFDDNDEEPQQRKILQSNAKPVRKRKQRTRPQDREGSSSSSDESSSSSSSSGDLTDSSSSEASSDESE